jgi:hypothetical protein
MISTYDGPDDGTKLHLNFVGSSSGGQPETNEQWSNREDEIHNYTLDSVNLETEKAQYSLDAKEVTVGFKVENGDTVYVLLVTYEDGDTFGRSYGNIYVVGVYESEEEADKVRADIDYDERHCNRDDLFDVDKKKTRRYKGYASWRGYFERFTSAEMFEMVVSKPNRRKVNG